jgi:hypothetical protein
MFDGFDVEAGRLMIDFPASVVGFDSKGGSVTVLELQELDSTLILLVALSNVGQ